MLNLSIGGPDFMDHPFVDKVGPVPAQGRRVGDASYSFSRPSLGFVSHALVVCRPCGSSSVKT